VSEPLDLPTTLYHYSTFDVVRSIIVSKTLWASDWRYTSDKTEFSYPRQVLGRVVKRIEASAESDYAHQLIQMVADTIANADTGLPLYVACLCAEADLPSQWEAYGRRGTGFAVGLDRAALYEAGLHIGYSLGYLRYDVSEQETLLHERLTEAISLVPQYINTLTPQMFLLTFGLGITIALTDIKNPRYSAEREWRLERQQLVTGISPRRRVRGPARIPYEEFPLEDPVSGKCLVTEVLAGPSATAASVEEIRRLLDEHGLSHVPLVRSGLSS
jgi:hypothetical protein